ncbi:MAG TPA: methyltransferase domain-containing protein [Vicinamibacterales bacterium]|nr:methyltransferase domain-containing protein [Vicinamibacterales bacterium]
MASLRRHLRIPEPESIAKTREAVRDVVTRLDADAVQSQASFSGLDQRVGQLARKLDRLDKKLGDDRALVGRIERLLTDRGGRKPPLSTLLPAPWPRVDEDWWNLDRCPACSHPEFHCVSEYNRFLVNGRAPEAGFEVYNYSLCHACGVVFAARRPRGRRFRALVEGFTENLGRMPGNNPVLNPRPLSDDDRSVIDRRAAHGPLVSEHLGLERHKWIPGVQADRFANAVHVEVLGSLLQLQSPRVLEVRSRTGAILAALRRLYDADVFAMAIFESQQHVVRSIYGIPSDSLIDFEHFTIPYQGQFDLVISNHMLTHAVTPQHYLQTVHDRLTDTGHLYLYNEPDDGEFLQDGQSMFRVLNPFHLQTFDRPSLERLLRGNGFEPVFIGHTEVNFFCLARKTAERTWTPMTAGELSDRSAAYERARDQAILRLPDDLQARFTDELVEVRKRAVIAGTADVDERGRLLLGTKLAGKKGSVGAAFH